jgi:hypothetical protein
MYGAERYSREAHFVLEFFPSEDVKISFEYHAKSPHVLPQWVVAR